MITTALDFLQECSDLLNETTLDSSAKRIRFFNRACRHVKRLRKWSWNKIQGTMSLTVAVNTYDLTAQFPNYNPQWGIFEVYVGGSKITPSDYSNRDRDSGNHFYLEPDSITIGFTWDIVGDEVITVWYTPRHTAVAASGTTLVPALPEDMLGPVALLMKSYVHGGKRQRVDERNTLLEFKEEIGEMVLQDASHKVKDAPYNLPTPMTYNRVKRSYRF